MPVMPVGGMPGSRQRHRTPLDKTQDGKAGFGICWAKGSYSFAGNGGAVGTIALLAATAGANLIPSGSVIAGVWIDEITPLDSGTHTATVALRIEGAGDTLAAAVVSGAPWSTAGRKNGIPRLNDATTWLKTTAARDISVVIAVEALTVGQFDVYVAYLEPSDP